MLDPKTIEKLKKKLIAQKNTITEELGKFTKKNTEIKGDYKTVFPQYGNNDEENALEVTAYETNLDIEHRLELDLRQINEALEKIAKNTYGVCENCGQEIEIKRLEAFPEAKLCLKCTKK